MLNTLAKVYVDGSDAILSDGRNVMVHYSATSTYAYN